MPSGPLSDARRHADTLTTRARLLAGVLFLFAPLLSACPDTLSLPDDVHVFGRYGACLERVSDSCVSDDGQCRTQPTAKQALLIGARRGTSEFLIAREGLPPLVGTLDGTRFRTESTVRLPDVCGCEAEVVETIEGDLLPVPVGEVACSGAAASTTCKRTPQDPAPLPLPVGESESVDYEKRYPALRGRVISEARAVSEGNCPCLPCRAEFTLTGRP